MFMGEYGHALDEKGRLFVPPPLRAGLGDRFVVTRGFEASLFFFPQADWDVLASRVQSLPLGRSDARSLARYLFSGAQSQETDSKGRILLPAHLRSHARLERNTVWLGVGTRVELWAQETWQAYSDATRDRFEALAEGLSDVGL